jgi:chitinase
VTAPRPDLARVAEATGVAHVVLAFAPAGDAGRESAWGGITPMDDPVLRAEIDALRARGGDVTPATGGATGSYLENTCRTAEDPARAYARVLDATGANRIDVAIEAPVPADVLVAALGRLQRGRGTAVTLTLPIGLQGLTPAGLDLVHRTAPAGLDVTVNGMDMNVTTGGDWGQAMVDAAHATLDQVRRAHPDGSEADQDRSLGITIMIGRNDTGAVTTPADARTVLDFARSRGIGFPGMWPLGRDSGACPTRVRASSDCSGTAQADLEFTRPLGGFGG